MRILNIEIEKIDIDQIYTVTIAPNFILEAFGVKPTIKKFKKEHDGYVSQSGLYFGLMHPTTVAIRNYMRRF